MLPCLFPTLQRITRRRMHIALPQQVKVAYRSCTRSGPAVPPHGPTSKKRCRPLASSARRRRCALAIVAVQCALLLLLFRYKLVVVSDTGVSEPDSVVLVLRSMTPSSATCWRATPSASSCTLTTWAPSSSRTSAGYGSCPLCCALSRIDWKHIASFQVISVNTKRTASLYFAPAPDIRLCPGPARAWREHRADGQEHHDEALHPPVLRAHWRRGVAGPDRVLVGNVGLIFTKADLAEVPPYTACHQLPP